MRLLLQPSLLRMSKGSDKISKISICYTSGRVLGDLFKGTLPKHDKYMYILNLHECTCSFDF
jgi:hypothetical protein